MRKNVRYQKIVVTLYSITLTLSKMARPIKETPILFGDDARRFEQRMKNPPREKPEDRKRREANYRAAMSMFVK